MKQNGLIILVVLLLAITSWPIMAEGAEIDSTTASIPEMNDNVRNRRLEQQATRMIRQKRIVPMADLLKQAERRQCRLDLIEPETGALEPHEIYERFRESVLIVAGIYKCPDCGRWHGKPAGGFFLDASGAFVTNHHVIAGKDNHTILAMTHDGRVFPVKEVLAANEEEDVAIARLDAPGAVFRPLALTPNAPVGNPVTVISHPQNRFYSLTSGIVSRYGVHVHGGRDVTMMTITADFAKGSSGGPVFDRCGAVVGFVGSTESVYYDTEDDKQENLQMVFKDCVPAASVLSLIER